MIAIVDYGVGNLFSLSSSLSYLGLKNQVTNRAIDLQTADRIILPGVGAFGDAIQKLRDTGLVEPILEECEKGKPLLGICLGMQLLFQTGYEYGIHEGLGLVPGRVGPMEDALPPGFKVPHIGWNSLHLRKPEDPLFRYTKEGDYFYYVHSYFGEGCEPYTLANSDYGIPVTGVVRNGSVYGTQFHPEKSGAAGLALLRAFSEL